jgi:hypothetical protein
MTNLIEWKWTVSIFRHFYSNSCTSIENCALLGFYEASSGNSLPTFLENYFPSIGCSETSVWYYHYLLCNNTEDHSFHLLSGGSMKSRNINFVYCLMWFVLIISSFLLFCFPNWIHFLCCLCCLCNWPYGYCASTLITKKFIKKCEYNCPN